MPFSLLKFGLNKDFPFERIADLPSPTDLKSHYDVVIIGGGGHGVATAYYLAKYHGITNVAVLEKAYLGGGNTARNTAVIRSNYLTSARCRNALTVASVCASVSWPRCEYMTLKSNSLDSRS